MSIGQNHKNSQKQSLEKLNKKEESINIIKKPNTNANYEIGHYTDIPLSPEILAHLEFNLYKFFFFKFHLK